MFTRRECRPFQIKLIKLTVGRDDSGRRLDRVLRKALPDLPLSAIYRLLRKRFITVCKKTASASTILNEGETIFIKKIDLKNNVEPDVPVKIKKQLDIIFENDDIFFINKASGIVTHGNHSLTSFALAFLESKLPASLSFTPGPLHRLDRETSGIIAFSKSIKGAQWFSAALRSGLVKKTYLALLKGNLSGEALWHDYLIRDSKKKLTVTGNGKPAVSFVTPLKQLNDATLVKIEIETGRTHQIRAQAAARLHPLLGDEKYSGGKGGFFLHAWKIEFPPENPLALPPVLTAPLSYNINPRLQAAELFV
ncbi:MAG: RluA family pseudouridine synthase [Termitinemataceae bacterium]|nr:MAG: RluA family pseudouridine synthase [Termitinemataceae bacterium]